MSFFTERSAAQRNTPLNAKVKAEILNILDAEKHGVSDDLLDIPGFDPKQLIKDDLSRMKDRLEPICGILGGLAVGGITLGILGAEFYCQSPLFGVSAITGGI